MSAIIEAFNQAGFDFIDVLIIGGVLGGVTFAGRKLLSSKNNSEKNVNPQQTLDVVTKSNNIQVIDNTSVERPVIKNNPNNQKYLANIKSSLDKLPTIYSRMIYSYMINQGFKNISTMRQDLEPLWKVEQWTPEQLKFYINYVNSMDFSDSIPSIKDGIENTCSFITECYEEYLNDIFQNIDVKYTNMKSAFILPTDKKIEHQTRTKSVIAPLFVDTLQSFDMSIRTQSHVRHGKPQFDSFTSTDFDWGSFLKNFGGGALAVANPFIGVPMILANIFGETEAAKKKQAFIDDYLQKVDECRKGFDDTAPILHAASVKAADYCLGRSQELNVNAVFFVCSKLDAEGVDLKTVCRSIVDKISQLDKEWGGSDSAYSL